MPTLQQIKRGLGKKHNVLVDDPHPQSLAARVLLKTELSILAREQWLSFRTTYLETELREKGALVCAYCGKPDLVIEVTEPVTKTKLRNLATLDHVNPRANEGAEYDLDNLVIACYPCNHQKGDSLTWTACRGVKNGESLGVPQLVIKSKTGE